MSNRLAAILTVALLAACSKAPPPPPSLSGAWQILGKDTSAADTLELEDQGGRLTGMLVRDGNRLYVAGTRTDTHFDLTGDSFEKKAIIHLDGAIDEPGKISGSYFLITQPELKIPWHAQHHADYAPGQTAQIARLWREDCERHWATQEALARTQK